MTHCTTLKCFSENTIVLSAHKYVQLYVNLTLLKVQCGHWTKVRYTKSNNERKLYIFFKVNFE